MPQPNEKELWEKEFDEKCLLDVEQGGLNIPYEGLYVDRVREFISNLLSHQRESIREEMDREWREREKKIIEIIKDSKAVFFVKKEDVEIPADEQLYELKSQIITDVEMYFYTLSLLNKGQKENK